MHWHVWTDKNTEDIIHNISFYKKKKINKSSCWTTTYIN